MKTVTTLLLVLATSASLARAGGPDADRPYVPRLGEVALLRDVTATSTFADRSKQDRYGAWRTLVFDTVDDQNIPRTAWCEGKAGEGIGEGITIAFRAPIQLDTIDIAAGVWLTEKLFRGNNAITSLAIRFDGAAPIKVKPPTTRDWLEVKVGKTVSSIAITIDGVKQGRMNDSCISGVMLNRKGARIDVLRGVDAAARAALPAALVAIHRALDADGRPGLDKLLGFPFVLDDSSSWAYGDQPPIKHASWKSVAAACKALAAEIARGAEPADGKAPRCPRTPNVGDRTEPVTVSDHLPGSVTVVFPSSREVSDTWTLRWASGAWKLHAIGYE